MKCCKSLLSKRNHCTFAFVLSCVVFSIMFATTCLGASDVQKTLEVSLSKNKVFVGDVINFIIKVQLPTGAQISATQDFNLNDLDIKDYDIKRISTTENIYELNFSIVAYKTGTFTINPLTVFYISSDGTSNLFFTPEGHIEVESVIKNNVPQDIKDIKPLRKIDFNLLYIFLVVVVSLLLIIWAIFIIRYITKHRKKSNRVEIDSKTKALNALCDLYKNESLSTRNFYYMMSEILRNYVSKQYAFDAMEMTTSEFFNKIKPLLPKEINVNDFKDYLKTFNLARYADFLPSENEIENSYSFTKRLLELL